MTTYRSPVPGAAIPSPLKCVDFESGSICADAFALFSPARGKRKIFTCPNVARGNGRCSAAAFCYPRKHVVDSRSRKKRPHFHQGIDIGAPVGTSIVSVTAGTVVYVQPDDKGTCGRVVSVLSELPDGRKFVFHYAHCAAILVQLGNPVAEQQVIAMVGDSGNAKGGKPHLHFEVIHSDTKGKPNAPNLTQLPETRIGESGLRVEPVVMLEQLGPWGMTEVFLPNESEEQVGAELAEEAHSAIESSGAGGYFPLGANNEWHGGVHLESKLNSPLVAPFDAKIVALRLDDDPASSLSEFGDTNFILLRHEISEPAAKLLLGTPKTPGGPVDPGDGPSKLAPGVGRGGTNPPELVLRIKSGLHGRFDAAMHPFYAPSNPASLTSPNVDDELITAIEAFQSSLRRPKKMRKKHPWPDGLISEGGYSWKHLFLPTKDKATQYGTDLEGADPEEPLPDEPPTPPPPPPLDPKRTVFSLLMHLGAAPFGSATAKTFGWLKRARVAAREDDAAELAAEARRKAREEDAVEADHKLAGRVGYDIDGNPDTDPGTAADIKWVQERLTRLAEYTGPIDGVWSDELRSAIAAFQHAHTDYYAKRPPEEAPGYVQKKGDTFNALRKTRAKLRDEPDTGSVDPLFAARLGERDEHGRAKIVSGLDIAVRSGDPLWTSGRAIGFETETTHTLFEQIHWGIFSEHPLVDWEQLVDDDDDRRADVPKSIIDAVEVHEGHGFAKDGKLSLTEIVEFYMSERSRFLRRTQCKFRSEWAVNVPLWIELTRALGFETDGLEESLAAQVIWPHASDVLPSPHVWHYNPIEFLGRYAEVLEQLRPRPPAPAVDPSALTVEVLFGDGQSWAYANVSIAYVGETAQTLATDVLGMVTFHGLRAGSGVVWIDEPDSAASFFDLEIGEHEVVRLQVAAPGPAISTGVLRVWVAGPDGLPLHGVAVTVEGETIEPADQQTVDGVATFSLAPGYYTAYAQGVVSETVAIAAGDDEDVYLQRQDTGAIAIAVEQANGEAAPELEVIVHADDVLLSRKTVGALAEFSDLIPGGYEVYVSGQPSTTVRVEVTAFTTSQATLILPTGDEPTPELDVGAIEVIAKAPDGGLLAGIDVVLLDDDNLRVADERTDGRGRARFESLDPGLYGITAEQAARDELGLRVVAGARKTVILQIEPRAAPPAVRTGSLAVSAFFTNGMTCIGLWVKLARDGAVIDKQMLDVHGNTTFEHVAEGDCRVFVDGYEAEGSHIQVVPDQRVPVPLFVTTPT